MSNVLVEWVKLVMAIEELKAVAYNLKAENSQLAFNLEWEKKYRAMDRENDTRAIRYWSARCLNLEAQAANDKRKRQLQAERRNLEKRKRELKRQHNQNELQPLWRSEIVHTYRMWQKYTLDNRHSPLSKEAAKRMRERLDEWKEAHRVKPNTDRS